jgi:hypothetical protein
MNENPNIVTTHNKLDITGGTVPYVTFHLLKISTF